MKVTVGEKVKEAKPFPKYMKTEFGLIVLMTADSTGIVTTGAECNKLGHQATNWDMGWFTDVESPEVAQAEKPFPKTMIAPNGCIVYFERPTAGMCLDQGSGCVKSGTFLRDWQMIAFTDCDFTVTLQND